jgi:thioredoxin reductase (NADPH)
MTVAQSSDPAYAILDAAMLAELLELGEQEARDTGEILYPAGDESPDFFIVLEGEVEVVRPGDEEVRVAAWGPGAFLGELNLITGQRALMTSRVTTPSRVLRIPHAKFRQLMSTKPDFSDIVFRAFLARRLILRTGDGASAIRIIGSRYSSEALALRAYVNRSRLPFTWIDLEDVDDPAVLLAGLGARPSDVPVVMTTTGRLLRPTPGELAQHLGLSFRSVPGSVCDLVIVGGGPAGLAAAVYGASEGLDTVALDSVAIGGQAGTSSRIENYMGFPNGISGEDLAARAAAQAFRLGARLNAPCRVVALRAEIGFHVLTLDDGSEISTRAVIVATGAHYRRLDVLDLERFEGAGVYYAATETEARMCRDQPVIVVGGGNSAGQAALYLAQQASAVAIAIRGDDLGKNMSRYLVDRIVADSRIEVCCNTEVRALDGSDHLERVTVEHTRDGTRDDRKCAGLFCFIGAVPATDWLGPTVALDRNGFVLTDRALGDAVAPGHTPLPYETSQPGVFAVGDVRHDSMKRVAAAVGEGSGAVKSVHEYLATHTAVESEQA